MTRESLLGDHRRRLSLNGLPNSKDSADDNLDLFSKSRRSLPHDSDVLVKLGRLSIGSAKQGKSGLDDLLSPPDGGKHDYDWLLTPPGSPLVSSLDGNDSKVGVVAPRSGQSVRSITTTKASRLSASYSENNHATKPTRSKSVTRPSVSSSQYSIHSNKATSILNTSSASVSSYIRPSTPTNRSSTIARPSTPSARSAVSRSTTPSKPRSALSTSSMDKPRPSQNSRPSTPTSRSQVSVNLTSPPVRTKSRPSRPSTPTRQNPTPSLSPVSGPSTPGGHSLGNGRSVTSVSHPSSSGLRIQPQSRPIMLPDFPLETPPNLRTTLPDRPISAGRSRPGVAHAAKGNVEPMLNIATVARRQSSPVVARGSLSEPTGRGRTLANRQLTDTMNSQRELSTRKPVRTSTDSTGFGRTISKKSLEMAIRHMDIRNGSTGFRSLTGTNVFPQSIRSTSQKVQPGDAPVNESLSSSSKGATAENGNGFSESGSEEDKSRASAKLTNMDIYESSRYEMIIPKEDLKNSNWLRSIDGKSDLGPIFDNGFELLPEPFDPFITS